MSVLIMEKFQTNYYKQEPLRKYAKLCRKISIKSLNNLNNTFQIVQEQQKETLQMILKSNEYLSWTKVELFKPIHEALLNPFIKVNYFRSDVLLKLMNILKYLEEKNDKLKYSNRKIIKINKLQNLLLRIIKSLGITMNIIIPVEQFPLESDFDIVFNFIWKRIWILTDGINMNHYKGSLRHQNVFEKIEKWIRS
ncbi:uncharacterized protein OCT59_004805 [Rhizophagus irregularis]|uniref:Uncharacterized protein n=1 Tax=Rhizophagus irregularis (strain DAOM 181602 / DAOM 197198 / MUCL 43194) TaxID=747089 RepID=U9TQC3_RHIID|nr:hypothetical protein OCT59_004805 [Rhizophagus irregularis]GET53441.1 hypothetical protein RIR_jg24905.t2 [Rhizophagus irregularis DAOM 181602=DAOM 197198]CAG8499996.1 3174_t:CDS:1 [Rhizophagus irregularis]